MHNLRKINRKGDVGQTLTWIIATIAILLILILFIVLTGIQEVIKWVKSFIYSFSGTGNIRTLEIPEQQQTLYALLRSELNSGIKVKDVIFTLDPYHNIKDRNSELEIYVRDVFKKILDFYNKPIRLRLEVGPVNNVPRIDFFEEKGAIAWGSSGCGLTPYYKLNLISGTLKVHLEVLSHSAPGPDVKEEC